MGGADENASSDKQTVDWCTHVTGFSVSQFQDTLIAYVCNGDAFPALEIFWGDLKLFDKSDAKHITQAWKSVRHNFHLELKSHKKQRILTELINALGNLKV